MNIKKRDTKVLGSRFKEGTPAVPAQDAIEAKSGEAVVTVFCKDEEIFNELRKRMDIEGYEDSHDGAKHPFQDGFTIEFKGETKKEVLDAIATCKSSEYNDDKDEVDGLVEE